MSKAEKALLDKKKPDLTEINDDLKPYFETMHKLDENDQFFHHGCKFCNSALREEGEKEYERTHVFKRVSEWFHKHGENLNINNVRIHLLYHYKNQEDLIRRRHYMERILPLINYKINKQKRIEVLLAMLEDKAVKYAAIEYEDDSKTIKAAETFVKIIKQATELMRMQAELEGEIKPVQVIIAKFQQVVVSALGKIEDPRIRMKVVKELEALKESNIIAI